MLLLIRCACPAGYRVVICARVPSHGWHPMKRLPPCHGKTSKSRMFRMSRGTIPPITMAVTGTSPGERGHYQRSLAVLFGSSASDESARVIGRFQRVLGSATRARPPPGVDCITWQIRWHATNHIPWRALSTENRQRSGEARTCPLAVPIRRTTSTVAILFRLHVSACDGEVSHSGLVRPPAKRVEV
jgi:hypothetical protein